jgi:hypothetical protein
LGRETGGPRGANVYSGRAVTKVERCKGAVIDKRKKRLVAKRGIWKKE